MISAAYGSQSEARTLPSWRQAIATALAAMQTVGSACSHRSGAPILSLRAAANSGITFSSKLE